MAKFEPIPGEVWRLVPDVEGRYEVSDHGRIRSLVGGCRTGSVRRTCPLLMTLYDNGDGYLVINLRLSGGYRCRGMHELVLRAFSGAPPAPHYQAAHVNGRRQDNRPENLRWATPSDNDADKDRHGTRRLRPRRVIGGAEHFRCTHCDTWRTRGSFRPLPVGRRSRCGISSWCVPCSRADSRDRKRRLRAAAPQ